MSARLRVARALAALVVGAAGAAVLATSPAYAGGACAAGTGVTVVVNSSVSCDGNGGGPAASNFADGGHTLSNYKGFVCSIDGYPDPATACHSYAPADAYWALFWSNGQGGGWTYASSGAYTLNVPTGGWVAFKFQSSSSLSYPGVTPYTAPAAPAPKPAPKPSASTSSSAAPQPSASASATDKASEATKASPSASASASSSAEASDGASDKTTNTSAEVQSDGAGSLVWVAAGIAALLVAGMGFAVWRRRMAGQP